MKPIRPDGRPRWLLRRCATFAKNHGWWPSAVELAEYVHGHWSRWTVRRDLGALRDLGLTAHVGYRRWTVTEEGWAVLRLPAVSARSSRPVKVTKKARRARKVRRQADVVAVLDVGLEATD